MKTKILLWCIGTVIILILASFTNVVGIYSTPPVQQSTFDVSIEPIGNQGLHSKKVSLSSEQYSRIEAMLISVKISLMNSTSDQETQSILHPLLTTLQEYNLLPQSMTVNQIMNLVFNNNYYQKSTEPLTTFTTDNHTNYNCMIMGRGLQYPVENPFIDNLTSQGRYLYNLIKEKYGNLALLFGILYFLPIFAFILLKIFTPLELFAEMIIGWRVSKIFYWDYFPVEGWCWTKGSNGILYWTGSLYGQIKIERLYSYDTIMELYIGIENFNGIVIKPFNFYLGRAGQVSIDYTIP
jgi:hypothetical protein